MVNTARICYGRRTGGSIMRLSAAKAFFPLLALLAAPAAGRVADTPIPGRPDNLPWRLFAEGEPGMVFIAVTGRSGHEATFASMSVWKAPTGEGDLTWDG